MTKIEAYNAMQEGLLITHKDFAENQYIYMDEMYIMRDESGYSYENSWDALVSDRFKFDWCIFKGVVPINNKHRMTVLNLKNNNSNNRIELVSHMPGGSCPGKDRCVEYFTQRESACLFCDINRNKLELPDRMILGLKEDNDTVILCEQEDDDIILYEQDDNKDYKKYNRNIVYLTIFGIISLLIIVLSVFVLLYY